jgi:serine/threonine-protein kinase
MPENDDINNETQTVERPPVGGDFIGTVINARFQIKSPLLDKGGDKGGIGEVFLASDLRLLGKDAVVKVLRPEALDSEYVSLKFQHEQEALIRLDHPNIVRILDAGVLDSGGPYIVMEHIPGASLRKMLDSEPKVTLALAAQIIESIGSALGAAHAQKILHRDIKPENIMLSPDEDAGYRVRLIDFGIARVTDSVTGPHTEVAHTVGTLRYMAPEQLQGTIEQTAAVDVYALGVVAYEMLTGDRPFSPQSTVDMFEQQRAGVKVKPTERRSDMSHGAESLMLSALAFEATDRPQDARQFAKALAEALRDSEKRSAAAPAVVAAVVPETMLPQPSAPQASNVDETVASVPHELSHDAAPAAEPTVARSARGKRKWAVLLAGLLLLALALPLGYALYRSNEEVAPVTSVSGKHPESEKKSGPSDSGPERFEYDLLALRPGGGTSGSNGAGASADGEKVVGAADVFDTGDKFRLRFTPKEDGYFYAFSEDLSDKAIKSYNILYPTPRREGGSARVSANKTFESGLNTFSGATGNEIVWLVFTPEEDSLLGSARGTAFASEGKVSGNEVAYGLSMLFADHEPAKAVSQVDASSGRVTVRGPEKRTVYRLELKHR